MKVVLVAVSLMLAASATQAVELRTPVTKQLYTCDKGLSRVSLEAASVPCCDGQLKCPQFLSTTGIHKALRDPRT